MTILIDTKNDMKRSIENLDNRVDALDREIRDAITIEVRSLREDSLADLKSSQQETRTSAHNAGKRASEALTAVTDLRRDFDQLHHGLENLRQDVSEVLSLLRAGVLVPAGGAAGAGQGGERWDGDGAWAEPAVLPEQRQTPEEEKVLSSAVDPEGSSRPAAQDAAVKADLVESERDDGQPAAALE
ncbi:hypothetical protein, partial [Streptomyces roseolilacinus]|uniref:hypothetical protein n=1 Tax=Streptomyces roseolilacinus TaxID=66904 RepID=UPI003813FDAF